MQSIFDRLHLGSAIVACGNIGSTPLKEPSTRVVDPVSQRDGGRHQKWKSCNDFSCDVECIKRNCAMISLCDVECIKRNRAMNSLCDVECVK